MERWAFFQTCRLSRLETFSLKNRGQIILPRFSWMTGENELDRLERFQELEKKDTPACIIRISESHLPPNQAGVVKI